MPTTINTSAKNYRKARALIRENGRSALGWMPEKVADVMAQLLDAPDDFLAERAQLKVMFPKAKSIFTTSRTHPWCGN